MQIAKAPQAQGRQVCGGAARPNACWEQARHASYEDDDESNLFYR